MASNAMTALLWFVAILILIPVSLWLLKRTPMGGAGSGSLLRSVAVLPLSAHQRIVTVEVGHGPTRRWLVLGVTAHNINTLHTLDPQETDVPVPNASAPTFAHLLGRLRPRHGGGLDQ